MVTRHIRRVILAAMGAGYVAKSEIERAVREIRKGGFSESEARKALRGMIVDAKKSGKRLQRQLDHAADRMLREMNRKKKR